MCGKIGRGRGVYLGWCDVCVNERPDEKDDVVADVAVAVAVAVVDVVVVNFVADAVAVGLLWLGVLLVRVPALVLPLALVIWAMRMRMRMAMMQVVRLLQLSTSLIFPISTLPLASQPLSSTEHNTSRISRLACPFSSFPLSQFP